MSEGFVIGDKSVAEREEDGAWIPVTNEFEKPLFYEDANGSEKPVQIKVAGAYSKTMRRAEETIRRRPLKAKKLTGEVFYDDAMEKAIACTLAWEGFEDVHGTSVELNRKNAAQIYTEYPWIYDAVWEAINDHKLFLKASSES